MANRMEPMQASMRIRHTPYRWDLNGPWYLNERATLIRAGYVGSSPPEGSVKRAVQIFESGGAGRRQILVVNSNTGSLGEDHPPHEDHVRVRFFDLLLRSAGLLSVWLYQNLTGLS